MRTHSLDRRYTAAPTLRTAIQKQGRMVSWLGQQIGVSKSQMSNVVTGRRTIGEADARVISAILGESIDQLFVRSDDTIPSPGESDLVMEVAS